MHQEPPADVPLATVFVRYWERHGSQVAMAPSIKANLAYWSEFFGEATVAELTLDRQDRFLEWLRAKRCARTLHNPTAAARSARSSRQAPPHCTTRTSGARSPLSRRW